MRARASKPSSLHRTEDAPLVTGGAFSYGARMKDALVVIMLVLLIGPLLIGVRRIRRLPRPSDDPGRRPPD